MIQKFAATFNLILLLFCIFNIIIMTVYVFKYNDATRAIYYGVLALIDLIVANQFSFDYVDDEVE